MPVFEYTAKKSPKETETGKIEADSENQALVKLRQMGLFPLNIQMVDSDIIYDLKNIKLNTQSIIFFTQEISDLLSSGVPLITALTLFTQQTKNKKLKVMTNTIAEKVSSGSRFYESLAAFPEIFSRLYISIIKSGEMSGTLEKVTMRLYQYYESNLKLKNKIIESLAYPLFLGFIGLLATIVLTVFVIPKLIPMFEDLGAELPGITVFIVSLSNFMTGYWQYILITIIVLTILLLRLNRLNLFKPQIQNFLLQIPFLNQFIKMRYCSEIFQSLESLVGNGISTLESLKITEESITFTPYQNELLSIIDQIENGSSFSKSLKNTSLFPPKTQTIVKVGEESGQLHQSLKKLADSFSDQFEKRTSWLTKFMGPFFIFVIAGFIGLIIVAMLLPILNLNVSF